MNLQIAKIAEIVYQCVQQTTTPKEMEQVVEFVVAVDVDVVVAFVVDAEKARARSTLV